MGQTGTKAAAKFEFACLRCRRPIAAQREWVDLEVRCPHCGSTQRVPNPNSEAGATDGRAPSLRPRRFFNFVCNRCKSVLEAHTGMCGHSGHCPTCDALFVIPHVNEVTGMPLNAADPGGPIDNPTPVHAYAASGEQAPSFVQDGSGNPAIECGKCHSLSEVDADRCAKCNAPFTLEGAAVASRWGDFRATAATVLGIIAIPGAMLFVPGLLAVALGWSSVVDYPRGSRPLGGFVGLILGGLSLPLGFLFWKYF